jgi:hypothetical protein
MRWTGHSSALVGVFTIHSPYGGERPHRQVIETETTSLRLNRHLSWKMCVTISWRATPWNLRSCLVVQIGPHPMNGIRNHRWGFYRLLQDILFQEEVSNNIDLYGGGMKYSPSPLSGTISSLIHQRYPGTWYPGVSTWVRIATRRLASHYYFLLMMEETCSSQAWQLGGLKHEGWSQTGLMQSAAGLRCLHLNLATNNVVVASGGCIRPSYYFTASDSHRETQYYLP